MNFISNLSLKLKIGGGFALVIILIVIIFVFTFNGFNNVERITNLADDANTLVKYAKDCEIIQGKYVIYNDSSYKTDKDNKISDIKKQIGLSKEATNLKSVVEMLDNLEKQADNYSKIFDQFYAEELEKQKSIKVIQTMDDIVIKEIANMRIDQTQKLEEEIQNNYSRTALLDREEKLKKSNDLNIYIYDMRLSALYFLYYDINESKRNEYKKNVETNLEYLLSTSKELRTMFDDQINIDQVDAIIESIDNYKKAFDTIVHDVELEEELLNKLNASATNFEKTAAQFLQVEYDAMKATQNQTLYTVAVLIIIGIILSIIIAFITTISITKPIKLVINAANSMASGDFTIELDDKLLNQKDEIGHLMNSFNEMLVNLTELIDEVKTTSTGINSGAEQVSGSAQSLSQSATELASSIEEMSSSIEEMEATIDQNAENAVEGEKIASKSANDAKEGGEAVSKTVESMEKIASTIQIITEIANNTNMLALNAAIEAARAGEHGEGFAVVATEVRKLAERSLKAATEIKTIANSSVAISKKAGDLINEVVPGIVKTSDMVQEITSASREQKDGMKQLTNASTQQEKVTQLVSSNSEELASASEEMASQTQSLMALVSKFKIKNKTNNVLDYKPQTNNINSSHNFETENKKEVKKTNNNSINISDSDDDDDDDFIQL